MVEPSEVKKRVNDKLKDVILACINCWNDLGIFLARDYHFTRAGVCPYQQNDSSTISNMIKDEKYEYYVYEACNDI